jgi:membrane fusion protein (multidrug efflux system)
MRCSSSISKGLAKMPTICTPLRIARSRAASITGRSSPLIMRMRALELSSLRMPSTSNPSRPGITFPGTVIIGHVDGISPASGSQFSLLPPDNATGNFTKVVQRIPVKIVPDPGGPLTGKLRPGMSAVVTIITDSESAQP